jgi:DNA polymerase (family X)
VLDRFVASIRTAYPDARTVDPAGELRRCAPLISSLAVVVSVDDPPAAARVFSSMPDLARVSTPTPQQVTGFYEDVRVTLYVATPVECGTALFHATGSDAHVQDMMARGLSDMAFSTEVDLYASVGLAFIPPELRHASGEIEAAAERRLPALVERSQIRGDLHMHSLYSDGRDELSLMVDACDALGYEYIAITDHSQRSAALRTLTIDDIGRQRDELERLRERFPHMAILHGVEVEVLPNGSLDFDDEILERFDIVLASVHDAAGQSADRLTERSLAALRHPLVNVLSHPANQLVGRFTGYALDFDAIYQTAAETGTALEVDGAPSHMDLDGERARAAVAAGATLVIDSDAHRVDALDRQMSFGVGTARRGWVEVRHVLNTRPVEEVRAFITAKRRGTWTAARARAVEPK